MKDLASAVACWTLNLLFPSIAESRAWRNAKYKTHAGGRPNCCPRLSTSRPSALTVSANRPNVWPWFAALLFKSSVIHECPPPFPSRGKAIAILGGLQCIKAALELGAFRAQTILHISSRLSILSTKGASPPGVLVIRKRRD